MYIIFGKKVKDHQEKKQPKSFVFTGKTSSHTYAIKIASYLIMLELCGFFNYS